jgi:uncharacterized membrane protein
MVLFISFWIFVVYLVIAAWIVIFFLAREIVYIFTNDQDQNEINMIENERMTLDNKEQ